MTARVPALVPWLVQGLALVLLLLLALGHAQALTLSKAEQAWIQSHGPVKVVIGTQQEPYFRAPDATHPPTGYAIEAFELVAQRAGLQWQYVTASSLSDGVAMLRRGEADMAAFLRGSQERASFVTFPAAVLPVTSVFVTRRDASSFMQGDGMAGRRVGVVAGSVNEAQVARHHPQAVVEHFPTQLALLEAVAAGSIDAALSELHVAVYTIESHLLANLQLRRIPSLGQDAYGPAVRRDLPLLHSILAKAIDTVTLTEQASLARRWLPAGLNTSFGREVAQLSDAERDWVQHNGEVRAGFDEHFAPFTRRGALGGFEGMGADVLRAAAAKAGLRVAASQGGSFSQVLDLARQDRINVVVGMARNAQRVADFHLIGPWVVAPTVLVQASAQGALAGDLDALSTGRLALLRDHFLIPQLRSRLPGMQLQEYATQLEALQAAADGRADAAIGNGHVVNQLITERYTGALRVTAVLPDADSELYFGVPRSQAQLARVLERGYEALSPAELANLRQQWLLARIEPGLPWRTFLQWGLPAALALLLVLGTLYLANRRLRQAHVHITRARALAEDATDARGRFLAYLAHEIQGGVGGIGAGVRLLLQRAVAPNQQPLLEAIAQSADQVGELLRTTLHDEVEFARGFTLQPAPLDLAAWWDRTLAPHRLKASSQGLSLQETPPSGWVMADAARLSQLVGNVLANAVKFTRQGAVQAHAQWRGGSEGRLRVEILDEGPGMTDDERQRIFEPYAQGKAGQGLAQGVGLGLAVCSRLVQAMGGRIEALPREGPGSLFVIELPLPAAPPVVAAPDVPGALASSAG